MFCWGAVTVGSSGVSNYATVAVTRLLLGIFEAGKVPYHTIAQSRSHDLNTVDAKS